MTRLDDTIGPEPARAVRRLLLARAEYQREVEGKTLEAAEDDAAQFCVSLADAIQSGILEVVAITPSTVARESEQSTRAVDTYRQESMW